jgi:hypothetical protein
MEETRITVSGMLPLSALDSLFESAYVVSRQGRIPGWNRDAEDLAGYPASVVEGSRCGDSILVHEYEKGRPIRGSCCSLTQTTEPCSPAVARADAALCEAKRAGRNKVRTG